MFAMSIPVALIWTGIGCAVLVGAVLGIRAYAMYRGKMLVKCPETGECAAVHVDNWRAVKDTILGRQRLALDLCSRWPERADCDQGCLSQIEDDPKGCLVWTAVTNWYRNKECVVCKRAFHEVHWHDRPPALLAPDRKTAQWDEIPAEKLPEVFSSYSPICWSCHMAARFRSEHPDLIIDRPGHRGAMNEYLEEKPDETHKVNRVA